MNPITSATAPSSTTSSSSQTQTDPLLGKDAFLQLMMVQLQHQDPLSPSDPTQYLSELAQFTSLEQQTNVAVNTQQSAAEQHTVTALALLGHTVSYVDPNGNTVTGLVQKVDFTSYGPALTVDGVSGIDPASVSEVS